MENKCMVLNFHLASQFSSRGPSVRQALPFKTQPPPGRQGHPASSNVSRSYIADCQNPSWTGEILLHISNISKGSF